MEFILLLLSILLRIFPGRSDGALVSLRRPGIGRLPKHHRIQERVFWLPLIGWVRFAVVPEPGWLGIRVVGAARERPKNADRSLLSKRDKSRSIGSRTGGRRESHADTPR